MIVLAFMISMAVITCTCIACTTIKEVAKLKYKEKPVPVPTISQEDLDKVQEETKLPSYDDVLEEVQRYLGGDN